MYNYEIVFSRKSEKTLFKVNIQILQLKEFRKTNPL